jgi:hypothetical protein
MLREIRYCVVVYFRLERWYEYRDHKFTAIDSCLYVFMLVFTCSCCLAIFYPAGINNMAGAGGPPAGNGAESNAGQKPSTGDSSTKQDSPTVRMEFPETWLWLDNVTG